MKNKLFLAKNAIVNYTDKKYRQHYSGALIFIPSKGKS